MKLGLRYYSQHDKWSCGAVTLKMILEHLGIKENRKKLIKLANVKPYTGTNNEDLIKVVGLFGLEHLQKDNSKVKDIVKYLKTGYPVIVNYFNPITRVGHYSIINGFDSKNKVFYFLDPRNGQDYSLPYKDFKNLWHNMKGDIKRWLMVVGRERIVTK